MKKRAWLLAELRAFFQSHNVLEVDVPVLGHRAVTDVFLSSLETRLNKQTLYLQTSPEFYMKRLLASGVGSIYCLGKSFRADEFGVRHMPEFTMLEWYRVGFDEHQLMNDVQALLTILAPSRACHRFSYRDIFLRMTGLNPHTCDVGELSDHARGQLDISWSGDDRSSWLDLLFSHLIEPGLKRLYGDGFCFIYDYPASQCALAKLGINSYGEAVAHRFEVFGAGLELANGYWELNDVAQQRARFEKDNHRRRNQNLPQVAFDEQLMDALEAGLPDCAGVALGVDRLLMYLQNSRHIKDVVPFGEF